MIPVIIEESFTFNIVPNADKFVSILKTYFTNNTDVHVSKKALTTSDILYHVDSDSTLTLSNNTIFDGFHCGSYDAAMSIAKIKSYPVYMYDVEYIKTKKEYLIKDLGSYWGFYEIVDALIEANVLDESYYDLQNKLKVALGRDLSGIEINKAIRILLARLGTYYLKCVNTYEMKPENLDISYVFFDIDPIKLLKHYKI